MLRSSSAIGWRISRFLLTLTFYNVKLTNLIVDIMMNELQHAVIEENVTTLERNWPNRKKPSSEFYTIHYLHIYTFDYIFRRLELQLCDLTAAQNVQNPVIVDALVQTAEMNVPEAPPAQESINPENQSNANVLPVS